MLDLGDVVPSPAGPTKAGLAGARFSRRQRQEPAYSSVLHPQADCGVGDRLAYRTVQLRLVSRREFGDIRMTGGLRTGEDVIQGASL